MEEEWTEWAGGNCPLDSLDVVEVRFRNGETCTGVQAGEWDWSHDFGASGYDIVAYRLSKVEGE